MENPISYLMKDTDSEADIDREFTSVATRVSQVCILCSLGLCIIKLAGGLIAHSEALVSDAINSAFDMVSGLIVIVGVKISRKDSDHNHPYGHERLESVATIILAIMLFVVGVFVAHEALESLTDGSYRDSAVPGALSILAALTSIIVKEILFWYTKGNADRIDSAALRAAAWDHRSDVISTSGALIGIVATRLGFAAGDLLASLVVCGFILRTAYITFREAIEQMIDRSADDEVIRDIKACIEACPGVLGVDMLQVRVFGNRLYVDLEISEDESLSLKEAHDIAEHVHDTIEERFPVVKHIMVHVNPEEV